MSISKSIPPSMLSLKNTSFPFSLDIEIFLMISLVLMVKGPSLGFGKMLVDSDRLSEAPISVTVPQLLEIAPVLLTNKVGPAPQLGLVIAATTCYAGKVV